jgi:hypothetical protein
MKNVVQISRGHSKQRRHHAGQGSGASAAERLNQKSDEEPAGNRRHACKYHQERGMRRRCVEHDDEQCRPPQTE